MYQHIQNEDGTYNTRCLYCFLTVASAVESSQDLEKVEGRHMCPERALFELMTQHVSECPCVRPH